MRGYFYSLPWLRSEMDVNRIVLCGFFSTVKRSFHKDATMDGKEGLTYGSNS